MSTTQKTNKPIALVVHGANFFGEKLAEMLSTQKTNIIVVDEFTRKNRDTIKRLKQKYSVTTYDLSGIPSLTTELKRVDYIFILLDNFFPSKSDLSSKKFISATNAIDALLKIGIEHSAKVLLSTSITQHRKIAGLKTPKTDKLSDVSSDNPYTSMELQRYCENLAAEYHDKAGLNIRICRMAEVIGDKMPLDTNTIFINMLKESITKPRITIPGEGLDYSYYIHVLDAVYGVIKAMFSNKTNGEVFSLSLPDEVSTLNLAYRILELNPKAGEIIFSEKASDAGPPQIYVPAKNLSKIGWSPKIPFEQALMETLQYFYDKYKIKWADKPEPKTTDEKKPEKAQAKSTGKGKSKKHPSEKMTPLGQFIYGVITPVQSTFSKIGSIFSKIQLTEITPKSIVRYILLSGVFVLIYVGLIAPFIQTTAGAGLAYYFGKKGYREAYSLDTEAAETSLKRASYFSSLMNSGWYGLRWIKHIPGAETLYTETSELTTGIDHLSNSGLYLIQGIHPYAEYFKNLEPVTSFDQAAGGGSRTYLNELTDMTDRVSHIETANIEISLATDALEGVNTSVYPSFAKSYIEKLVKETKNLGQTIDTVDSFAYFLPDILGKDGRKTYIILFQNPMELRSTGGWLTSYAVIGIEHGQVRTMTVDDVYNADGQLNEIIPPPESMQKALGIRDWNLSLSNWSPDFPQSAEAAEYFLKLEDKVVTVDGVIAIDLEYIRELIDIWGEIDVPGETEPVTQDNIYDKVIEIHRAFTPGSTDKPVFLSNLANEILKKLLAEGKGRWSNVAEKTSEALAEKHIQIYLHNTQVSAELDTLGWSGHLQPKTNIVYPVEWNWGGNKANYFLTRSTTLTSNILDENTIQQKITISYQNSSTTNTYPEGDYKNYIRVYLPRNSRIMRIEGLENTNVTTESGYNLDMVSGWVTVPVQSKKTISISYKLEREKVDDFPLTVEPGEVITFSANILKQPGLLKDPLTFEVTYPEGWEPIDLTDTRREINSLIQRTDLETDKELTITWQR